MFHTAAGGTLRLGGVPYEALPCLPLGKFGSVKVTLESLANPLDPSHPE